MMKEKSLVSYLNLVAPRSDFKQGFFSLFSLLCSFGYSAAVRFGEGCCYPSSWIAALAITRYLRGVTAGSRN